MMNKRSIQFVFIVLAVAVIFPNQGVASQVAFDGFDHGQIVNRIGDMTIGAENRGGGPNWAVIFDSRQTGTADPDLESNAGSGYYEVGNLAGATLGNLLIVQESYGLRQPGVVADPDDEGSRPAGSLFFEFDVPVISFGFDLVDVEGPEEWGTTLIVDGNPVEYNFTSGFFAAFTDVTGERVVVGFDEFTDPNSPFYDPTIEYGNHSANRIDPITAASLGLSEITEVEINFGGSAAIDNINYKIPIPSSIILLGIGLSGVIGLRRRFKNAA